MKSTAIWALSALNVLLLVLLVMRSTGESTAIGQVGRPGDYLMIPGNVIGGTNSVVYILDQTSHQLSALSYDDSGKKLDTMPAINIDRALGTAGGRRGVR